MPLFIPHPERRIEQSTRKSQLAFYDISNRTESLGKVGSSKPDLGTSCKDGVDKGHLKDTHKCIKGGHLGDYIYTSRMGEVYMFVEVKKSENLDFFTDPLPLSLTLLAAWPPLCSVL